MQETGGYQWEEGKGGRQNKGRRLKSTSYYI